jgi:serine phosphatase RsbU (regulator of sigma subunit)
MNQLEAACRNTSRPAGPASLPPPDQAGALPRIYGEVAEDLTTLVGSALRLAGLGGVPAATSAEILQFARPVGRILAPGADPDRLEAAAHLLGLLAEREAAVQNLAAHAAQLWREIRFFLSAELVTPPITESEAAPGLLAAILATIGAHRGSIFVAEPPRLKPMASQGIDPDLVHPIAIEDPESITAWVFRHGAPLLVTDPRRRPRRLKARGLELPPEFHDGFLSVPLLLPDPERTPIGVLNLAGRSNGILSPDDVKVAAAMAQVAALSLHRARITGQALASARLREELRLAAELHASLLPAQPPSWPGFEIAAATRPAAEGMVGGDYYDFVPVPGALNVIVADVQGHGLGAAMCASSVRSALRTALGLGLAPGAALTTLNRTLAHTSGESGVFASAVVVRLEEDRLTCAAAGHPPVVLIGRDEPTTIVSSGPPAGAVPDVDYADEVHPLAPGDLVALYSDGLLGHAASGTGVQELAASIARAARGRKDGADRATEGIVAELIASAPEVADDRTLVVAMRTAAAYPGSGSIRPAGPGTHGGQS